MERYFLLILLPFCALMVDGSSDDYFVLKNPHSNLVLDLEKHWVILQNFTGHRTQLWKLEPTRKGLFYIVNKNEGKVLDGDSRFSIGNTWIVVSKKISSENRNICPEIKVDSNGVVTNLDYCQQWYIEDGGVIANACGHFAVTIMREEYKAGAYLESQGAKGEKNQKFVFEYV